jgi:DNA (cytosine-5)-methyltransferase 1
MVAVAIKTVVSMVYYNENAPFPAQWLRNLIDAGLLPKGHVDERSIEDVKPDDLRGYTQCHFFAGIGGWPLALAMAGWPSTRPVWTGSCPCQPWSHANVWKGGGKGYNDERHLFPAWASLVRELRPDSIFGEQVASAIGKGWLDSVFDELEDAGYSCGASVLPACGVGAGHERKRLWWCANAGGKGRKRHQPLECVSEPTQETFAIAGDVFAGARRALGGDTSGLLLCDGVPLKLARDAVKCYGNAIVPQLAAEFVAAYLDTERDIQFSMN